MSTENNSETNSKRSRYEIELLESRHSSFATTNYGDERNVDEINQNVSSPSAQNETFDSENSLTIENNSETNSRQSRHEMEFGLSEPSENSSATIFDDEINAVDTDQNVLQPSEQNENFDNNENRPNLLEMLSEMKMMSYQLKTLAARINYIEFKRIAGDTAYFDTTITAGVDFSELNLTLNTVDDVNQFEYKLKSNDFKMAVLSSLVRIGGTTGTMDANKVVRMVFSKLFNEELKRKYTWAGHGGRAAFKDLHEIRNLIFEVVVQADRRYSLIQCDYDISHKLLKTKRLSTGRAPLTESNQNNINASANSQTVNGLSGVTDPSNGILNEAWSHMMGAVFPQIK